MSDEYCLVILESVAMPPSPESSFCCWLKTWDTICEQSDSTPPLHLQIGKLFKLAVNYPFK